MARKDDLRKAAGSWLGAGDPTEADQAPAPADPPAERSGASATPKAPGPADAPGGGRRVQVTTYLDQAEADALAARAAADDRSVAYVVRAAVRAWLGLP